GGSAGSISRWFGPQEQEDGREIVEWIASQDWCDGNVGMTGISYPGFTSIFVAAQNPPHLKAIVPIYGTSTNYDLFYPDGNMRVLFPGFIGTFRLAFDFMPPAYRDPDGRWARVWAEHLEKNRPLILSELAHQTDDHYQHEVSMILKADGISAATYII